MADIRKKIADLFSTPAKRMSKFGNVITRLDVSLVRCHTRTVVDIVSPITAISGLNGCGKSTLLQLVASAYDSDQTFSITNFIKRTRFDDPPVGEGSFATFVMQQENNSTKTVNLIYNTLKQRWDGYRSRPSRKVFFAGVGFFVPRSESQDFVFRHADTVTVTAESEIADSSRNWAAKILSSRYDKIVASSVTKGRSHDTILQVHRSGIKYSEAQMGCGEARIHYLLQRLDQLPPKSLILLEEPENCLHPRAQYAWGTYLMELVESRGHQVFISTHGEMLMRSLPQDSLIYLHKAPPPAGITAIPGLTAMQARSLLSEGYEKALTVFVEDEAAELVLTELLGFHRPELLKTVDIRIHGLRDQEGNVLESGKESIKRTMRVLRQTGIHVAAVLDADDAEDVDNYVFKLPGSMPPEKELLSCDPVLAFLETQYQLERNQLLQELADVDCHRYFTILSDKTSRQHGILIAEAARVYAQAVAPSDAKRLTTQLTDATH